MTTPAIPAPCDVCGAEPAGISLMNLADYSAVKLGFGCAPPFLVVMATDMAMPGEGGHAASNWSEDCNACSTLHHLVIASALEAGPAADPAADPAAAAPAPDPAGALPRVHEAPGDPPYPGDVSRETSPEQAGQPAVTAAGPAREPSPPETRAARALASAVSLETMAELGVRQVDIAVCPACETVLCNEPGNTTYVCGYCGGIFDTAAAAGMTPPVPDGGAGRAAAELWDAQAAQAAGGEAEGMPAS